MNLKSYVRITSSKIVSDKTVPHYEGAGAALISSAFKSLGTRYAKFYKMDTLSKLGFLASEILLADESERFQPREDRAVILMNSTSSICDDRHYQDSIKDPDSFFPSPALFVYTLPNIVTGEIAIRNKYFGETSFYVLPKPEPAEIFRITDEAFRDRTTRSVLGGWLDCVSDDEFEAVMFLVEETGCGKEWNINELKNIFK